jgi:hypothetical protein
MVSTLGGRSRQGWGPVLERAGSRAAPRGSRAPLGYVARLRAHGMSPPVVQRVTG